MIVPRAGPVLLALAAVAAAGCAAKRTLTISSEPEGALVRLDDAIIGETPLTVDFEHYGARRVTLYLPGHLTNSRRVWIRPPWYGFFPLDYVSEVLLPLGWRDRHRIHFDLEPGVPIEESPDLRSVLDRAEVLRRAGPDGPQDLPPIRTVTTQRMGNEEPEPVPGVGTAHPRGPRQP